LEHQYQTVGIPTARDTDGNILNVMSIDVEDYYHAHALENYFTRDTWPGLEKRVKDNTLRILDLMDEHETKATFFVLGSVAADYPALMRDIVERGHELASHGMEHYRASDQDPATFLSDVTQSKDLLENATGKRVHGYRAASFSIKTGNWWAFDVLEQAGYTYSSSTSAGHRHGVGPATPNVPFRPGSGSLIEIPISTSRVLGRELPTGGGYFRLVPQRLFRRSVETLHTDRAAPAIFYFHPWEIDPGQPRARVNLKTRFRHLVNIKRMEQKVADTLDQFRWGRMTDVFGDAILGNTRSTVGSEMAGI